MRRNLKVAFIALLMLINVLAAIADDTRVISDLSSAEIAKYATFAWIRYKSNPISGRLLYHGLLSDFRNPVLLGVMSDVLVEEVPDLSAVVFEYIYSFDIQMDNKEKKHRDTMYASAMWLWGLSRTKSGQKDIQMRAFFDDPYQFIFDKEGFKELIRPVIELAGGLENAVRGVHTYMGLCGGILKYKGASEKWTSKELFESSNFILTEDYEKWLAASVKDLEKTIDFDPEFNLER